MDITWKRKLSHSRVEQFSKILYLLHPGSLLKNDYRRRVSTSVWKKLTGNFAAGVSSQIVMRIRYFYSFIQSTLFAKIKLCRFALKFFSK